MRPIQLDEIEDLTTYEKSRPEFRQRILRLKQTRRVQAGEKVSLVFEHRETARFQIQEMVRAERLVDPVAIAHEIEIYNALLPGAHELSATLFLEVTDPARIRTDLEQLIGLDNGACVWIELEDGDRAYARFEAGHSEEGRISAVHCVRFPFEQEQVARFREPDRDCALVVDHPRYQARVRISPPTRQSLLEDLV